MYFVSQVTDRMEDLKRQYDEKLAQKDELRKKAELTELKLDRAGKLVSGLAGERDRWEASVKVLCMLDFYSVWTNTSCTIKADSVCFIVEFA
jgi:predicted nuclease with TOPRIM domain